MDSAVNTLVVLADAASCDGVVKSVRILVNLPDGQSSAYLRELTVTLVAYRYSTDTHQSELAGSLTLESPRFIITPKEEVTELKAVVNPEQKERLHVDRLLYDIGVVLTGREGMRLEWGLSTKHRSYSVPVDSPDEVPEHLPQYTIDTRTPSIIFEIGAGTYVCVDTQEI